MSRDLANLSDGAERLFWRLVTFADDFGRFDADPDVVRGACVPLLAKTYTRARVAGLLLELFKFRLVDYYFAGDRIVGRFLGWKKHQGEPRAKESRHAQEPENICMHVQANVPVFVSVFGSVFVSVFESVRGAERASPLTGQSVATKTEGLNGHTLPEPSNGNGDGPHADAQAPLTPEELMAGWNEICVPLGLPAVREVRGSRRDDVMRRLREHPKLEYWQSVFRAIPKQGFLLGKNTRSWKVNFDFLFANDRNATKIAELGYGK